MYYKKTAVIKYRMAAILFLSVFYWLKCMIGLFYSASARICIRNFSAALVNV